MRMHRTARAGCRTAWPEGVQGVCGRGSRKARLLTEAACEQVIDVVHPVGFHNSATSTDLGFYAARSYSLMGRRGRPDAGSVPGKGRRQGGRARAGGAGGCDGGAARCNGSRSRPGRPADAAGRR
jgi:hypothetical protein